MFLRLILFVLCGCIFVTGENNTFGYPLCQGLAYHFDGYTYIHVPSTGERLWSHCSFPNPFEDHQRCGRPQIKGRHFLCDPDKLILSEVSSKHIDQHLTELQRKTPAVCLNSKGESESFIVAIAVIDRILIPDIQSPNLCSNDCGRLEPYLDLSQRYPSSTEQDEIMRNFADNLRQEWSLGSCDNDVIILYCKEFNKVHVSAGSKASYYLTGSRAADLHGTFINYINEEGYQKGLEKGMLHMIESLRFTLRGFTLGHAIMIIHISTMICFCAGLYFYMFVRKTDIDVWGSRFPWVLSDLLIQLVTGIWFVRGMVLLLAKMSHHEKGLGLLWALGAACSGLSICIILYFASP